MKSLALVVAGALVLAAASPATATGSAGTTALPVLQVPLGARALGMGGAFSGVASDVTALEYNPGGLARLNAHEVALSYLAGVGGTTIQNFSYAAPTSFYGISGDGYTTIAGNLLTSQAGNVTINTLNSDGTLGSSRSVNAGDDLIGTLGYAERIGMSTLDLKSGSYDLDHFFGIAGKYIHSTLAQSYHATAYAADVGYLVYSADTGVSGGVSGLNLGQPLRYGTVSDPMPMTLRAGGSWQVLSGDQSVLVATDGDYLFKEQLWHANAGVEYFWMKMFGARAGYQFNRGDQGGFTIGLGLRWQGRLMFDYAWDLGDLIGNGQRVTLTYRFGAVPPEVRARQRHPFEDIPDEPARSAEPRRPVDAPARPLPRERPQGAPGWIY